LGERAGDGNWGKEGVLHQPNNSNAWWDEKKLFKVREHELRKNSNWGRKGNGIRGIYQGEEIVRKYTGRGGDLQCVGNVLNKWGGEGRQKGWGWTRSRNN